MSDPYRAAIVGCGGISHAHAGAIAELEHIALVACSDANADRAAEFAAKYAVPQTFASLKAMLDEVAPDLLILASWPSTFVELVEEAAGRVPAILCQKPLGRNGADALRIREFVRNANPKPVFMEGFMYRHHPQTLRLLELVTDGAIGEVVYIRGNFTTGRPSLDNWRRRPELGGGSRMDLGCYPVNAALAITDGKPLKAAAFGWVNPESGAEERLIGTVGFDNGVAFQMDCGMDTPRWRNIIEVVGTGGVIESVNFLMPDSPGSGLRVYREKTGETEWLTFTAPNKYALEITHLLECLETGAEPRVRLDRTVEAMLTIESLYTSMLEGRMVDIPPLR